MNDESNFILGKISGQLDLVIDKQRTVSETLDLHTKALAKLDSMVEKQDKSAKKIEALEDRVDVLEKNEKYNRGIIATLIGLASICGAGVSAFIDHYFTIWHK